MAEFDVVGRINELCKAQFLRIPKSALCFDAPPSPTNIETEELLCLTPRATML